MLDVRGSIAFALLAQLSLLATARAQIGTCGSPATPIHTIQGPGTHTAIMDQRVEIEGVVVGDFQKTSLNGFYVQEEDTQHDDDPNTSEGMFVFQDSTTADVELGQLVRVAGNVLEFDGTTELTHVRVLICPGTAVATAQKLELPLRGDRGVLERYEGMLVEIAQPLTVTGNYDLGRYGTLELSVGGRLFQPTQLAVKGPPALELQAKNDLSRILLDDGDGRENPVPIPYKSADNTRRVGDTLPGLRGVLDERFESYRIQPVEPPHFEQANPRPPVPAAPTGLRVASVNVYNYFTTLKERGASTVDELARQRTKLLMGLRAIDADVLGLIEVQNDVSESVNDIVTGLNGLDAEARYAFIDTGEIGTDAIKVALLYRPGKVAPRGKFALLDGQVDARFDDKLNRPVLAQTFEDVSSGARFTVALNHWKSKATPCDGTNDPDLKDGQGNCNLTRTKAAEALIGWLAKDPTQAEDPDVLIIGDLNSLAKEDPILALERAGYTSLVRALGGEGAYSFQYDAQSGYLDHAFASASLNPQVEKLLEWHINADEPVAADYNTEKRPDDLFDASTPYRMSDHDPLIVDLKLTGGAGAGSVPGGLVVAAVPVVLLAAWLALRSWRRRA